MRAKIKRLLFHSTDTRKAETARMDLSMLGWYGRILRYYTGNLNCGKEAEYLKKYPPPLAAGRRHGDEYVTSTVGVWKYSRLDIKY